VQRQEEEETAMEAEKEWEEKSWWSSGHQAEECVMED
jgi:hypothetical protein